MSFFKCKNIKINSGIKVLLVTYSFVIIFVNINHVARYESWAYPRYTCECSDEP